MKTYIFDQLNTADGYEIYWLHDERHDAIDPDELYYYKDEFEEKCKEIVFDEDVDYIDYVFEEEIQEWIREAEAIQKDQENFYR